MRPVRTAEISNSASSIGINLILGPGIVKWCDEKAPVAEFQREALSQASSMPLGSILVVAFFGPGWLLLFGDNGKQQTTNR